MKFYRQALYSTILAGTLFSLAVPSQLMAMELDENPRRNNTTLAPKGDALKREREVPSLKTSALQAIGKVLEDNQESRFQNAQSILSSLIGKNLSPELSSLKQISILSMLKELFPKAASKQMPEKSGKKPVFSQRLIPHSELLMSETFEPKPECIHAFREHFSTWTLDALTSVSRDIAPYQNLQTSFREALAERKFEVYQISDLQDKPFISSLYVNMRSFSKNDVHFWVKQLKQFPHLKKKIDLDYNQNVDEDMCQRLAQTPLLLELKLMETKVGDESIIALAQAPKLEKLDLRGTKVGNEGVKALAQAPNLQELDLSNTDVTYKSIIALAQAPNLRMLGLIKTKVGDEGIIALAQVKSLQKLILTETKVGDEGVKALAQAPKLELLVLMETKVGEEGVIALAQAPNLRKLYLYDTDVTDNSIIALAQAPKLEQLYLNSTKVGDEGIKALAQAPNLRELDLSNTDVTDKSIIALAQAPKLEQLYLRNTSVTKKATDRLRQAFKQQVRVIRINDV